MSVLTCTYQFGNRSVSFGEHGETSHTQGWIICTDKKEHHPFEIAKLASLIGPHKLPGVRESHPVDLAARVKSLRISQTKNDPTVFFATAEYDRSVKKKTFESNPLRRNAIYRLESQNYQRLITKDLDKKPIQNSLEQIITPALVQDDSRPILVAVRNFRSLAEILAIQQQFKDAVNINPFYGAGPRQAKVISISAGDLQEENETEFYPGTIRIAFKGEGENWDREILDAGTVYRRYLFDPNGVAIKDKDGKPQFQLSNKDGGAVITSPLALAKDGSLLKYKNEGLSASKREKPNYLSFRTYPERDFKELHI